MSALGHRASQAQDGISELESALEKTQRALDTAQKVDVAASKAKRRSGKFFKLMLLLTVVGIAVVVAKKALGGSSDPSGSSDPYGTTSTDK
ncbi:MAG: hypothetical protein M3Y51_08145 [Actinomycetota bacterium]|nr:hypothetical protein [Actinomycetota bacterium]